MSDYEARLALLAEEEPIDSTSEAKFRDFMRMLPIEEYPGSFVTTIYQGELQVEWEVPLYLEIEFRKNGLARTLVMHPNDDCEEREFTDIRELVFYVQDSLAL